MPAVALSLALAAASLAPLVAGPADAPRLGTGWRVATLPRQRLPVTRFVPELVAGRPAVRIDADASYGNLAFDLRAGTRPQRLRWSWQMELPNPGTQLRSKAGDDTAARVCLAFDLPVAALPFEERVSFQMARAVAGQHLPAATLCWVWGAAEAPGERITSAYTGRVRYIVLRNAGDAPGTWFDEVRDIKADFLQAFGDESKVVPPLLAVLIGGDADNTGARSVAHVGDLRFEP